LQLKQLIYPLFFLLIPHFAFSGGTAPAAPEPKVRILFIFDASQSMLSQWHNGKKIDGAKKILAQMIDSLSTKKNVEVALRVYGHQSQLRGNMFKDCKDTKLEVPFAKANHAKIKQKILEIVPKGTTPIAMTLEESAKDFPDCANCKNIIILITDGIEECGGDPCAISQALQRKGIVLRPFIIGIGLGEDLIGQFECVGKYVDATNEETFFEILEMVVSEAITNTTLQVNLNDTSNRPTETNVLMTFNDSKRNRVKYSFIHSLNHKGNPDTLSLDSDINYTLKVFTLPWVVTDTFRLKKGIHNTINASTPRGSLNFKISGYSEYKNLKIVIRSSGKNEILNVQDLAVAQKYLTGNYDAEILTIPRIYLRNIEVKQSHTTNIDIPQPGTASFLFPGQGFASLYSEEKSGLKLVYNFEELKLRQILGLQPGNYRIVFRALNARQAESTMERTFKIESGGSVSVQFN
jgi:Ca-activated chloride channel homolog